MRVFELIRVKVNFDGICVLDDEGSYFYEIEIDKGMLNRSNLFMKLSLIVNKLG